jgi:hypothetical protein
MGNCKGKTTSGPFSLPNKVLIGLHLPIKQFHYNRKLFHLQPDDRGKAKKISAAQIAE